MSIWGCGGVSRKVTPILLAVSDSGLYLLIPSQALFLPPLFLDDLREIIIRGVNIDHDMKYKDLSHEEW